MPGRPGGRSAPRILSAMFSRRLKWPCPPNRLSRLLDEKRTRPTRLFDLTESNPTRAGLSYPAEAIAAALADPGVASYEPSARGLESARAAVAEDATRRGRPVPLDRVVLTASTSEAYALLFKLLADPGETVLVPRPSYPLFDYLAALEGLRVSTYPLAVDDRVSIDLDALESALDARDTAPVRAVVLVNPNNPTGTALRRGERSRPRESCSARGVALISDEVFLDYLDQDEVDAAARRGDPILSAVSGGGGAAAGPADGALTFVLDGLSKSCGLPQMKLGWIVVDGPGALVSEALERLEPIADPYLSVGTPVMRAAGRFLEIGARIRSAIGRRLAANLEALRGRLGPGSA